MYAWSIDVYSNIIRYECVLENTDKKWWSAQLWQLLTIEDTNEIENVLQSSGWLSMYSKWYSSFFVYSGEAWKAFQRKLRTHYIERRDLKCKDRVVINSGKLNWGADCNIQFLLFLTQARMRPHKCGFISVGFGHRPVEE